MFSCEHLLQLVTCLFWRPRALYWRQKLSLKAGMIVAFAFRDFFSLMDNLFERNHLILMSHHSLNSQPPIIKFATLTFLEYRQLRLQSFSRHFWVFLFFTNRRRYNVAKKAWSLLRLSVNLNNRPSVRLRSWPSSDRPATDTRTAGMITPLPSELQSLLSHFYLYFWEIVFVYMSVCFIFPFPCYKILSSR